jgi:hypothetical protein
VLTGVGDEGSRLESATDRGGGRLGRRTGGDAPGQDGDATRRQSLSLASRVPWWCWLAPEEGGGGWNWATTAY